MSQCLESVFELIKIWRAGELAAKWVRVIQLAGELLLCVADQLPQNFDFGGKEVSSAGSPATLESLAARIEAALHTDGEKTEVAAISPTVWLMVARFAFLLLKELDL